MAGRLGNSKRLGDDYLSLHGRVIEELRQAILSRRLKPGERLVEGRLADELGVSRNPVREAIRVLESEGLVEVTARRGASVDPRENLRVRLPVENDEDRHHSAGLGTSAHPWAYLVPLLCGQLVSLLGRLGQCRMSGGQQFLQRAGHRHTPCIALAVARGP